MGSGDDTFTFSGQAGSGAAQFKGTDVKLGAGADYMLANGLVSASASTIRGNEGDDEIVFENVATDGRTASDVLINANAGSDSIQFSWTGTEANGVGVLGGGGDDTISATFNLVSANTTEEHFLRAKVGGSQSADEIYVRVLVRPVIRIGSSW